MTHGAILTTGGSRGIGAAIAATIASTGRRVGVLSRRPPPAEMARHPLVDHIEADLTDAPSTNAAIRAWHDGAPVDGLILSAVSYGHGPRHPVLATTVEEWDEVMAVNLRGQFVAVSAVLPELLTRPRALILAVTSVAALQPAPGRAHYAASKAGALAFFRALTEELSATHVSVVQVMPRNQVATPGLAARRPPGFAFEGYDPPTVFDPFVRTVLTDLGEKFDGALVTVDSDGHWEVGRA
ncbi:beta-ketoacyl-ACP reductase [Streptomyces sp. NBRC 14336]|uniref:SDR family NAD(P)-dependent oxidoreductase n=1 Tax=Streptomyces sp. NBRC 14336 TaxID=3030992 RepID=UPI00249FCA07|nr:SDR family NAD(P)-dependent oxidoreductase [Streptomyces sp. NBRC 14336]GLW46799.1 beta-ketoacyl-ACP reductase [Streptomyces sp. NBRC 14336]